MKMGRAAMAKPREPRERSRPFAPVARSIAPTTRRTRALFLLLGLTVLLASCQGRAWPWPATATPIPTPTQPPPSPTRPVTPTPAGTPTPVACDRVGPGLPLDVTVPDDTVLDPGTPFTKVWRVRNLGTCTWTREYALVWVSGPRLAQVTRVPLAYEVPPQATVDIEVPMRAPREGGIYQSNWMLSNDQGHTFGLGSAGDQPLWVRIWVPDPTMPPVAAETPAATPRPTRTEPPTAAPTATVTPTAPPLVHESRAILPAAEVDLDALAPDGTPDLAYRRNDDGAAFLEPLNGAQLGVFGPTAPDQAACRQAPRTQAPLPLSGLPPGMYLCFTTDAGRVGWVRFVSLDPDTGELTLEVLTWRAADEEAP